MEVISEIQKNPHFPFTLKKARNKHERDELVFVGSFLGTLIMWYIFSGILFIVCLIDSSGPVGAWALVFALVCFFRVFQVFTLYTITIKEEREGARWVRRGYCRIFNVFLVGRSNKNDLSLSDKDHPGQIYIRLQRQRIWFAGTYSYYLALGFTGRQPFQFTSLIDDLKMARLLGRQIAKTLQLDYFDYEDVSDEHVLVQNNCSGMTLARTGVYLWHQH